MRFIVKSSAITLIAAIGITAISISAQDRDSRKKDQKKSSEIILIGEPESCVKPRNIRSTKVLDNKTIEFRMFGGKTYRNNMEQSCPGLGKGDPITYTIRNSNLCHVDIFRVLRTTAGRIETQASCSFGKFQEIKKIKRL